MNLVTGKSKNENLERPDIAGSFLLSLIRKLNGQQIDMVKEKMHPAMNAVRGPDQAEP